MFTSGDRKSSPNGSITIACTRLPFNGRNVCKGVARSDRPVSCKPVSLPLCRKRAAKVAWYQSVSGCVIPFP
jgi:hypothetical protein